MSIKRLLLAAGILGAVAGCGQAAVPAAPRTPAVAIRSTGTPSVEHPRTDRPVVRSTHPAAAPPAAPVTSPAAPPAAGAAPKAPAVASAPAPAGTARPATPRRPQRNLLTGPHGLNTVVGSPLTDCTGATGVPNGVAVIDACYMDAVLFVGHNRGVFTPLLSYVVGDVITWYDQTGRLHHLRVIAVRNVSSSDFPPVLGAYEFQTCLYPNLNSSMDHDLDAIEV